MNSQSFLLGMKNNLEESMQIQELFNGWMRNVTQNYFLPTLLSYAYVIKEKQVKVYL
jgi:hypothetical protein